MSVVDSILVLFTRKKKNMDEMTPTTLESNHPVLLQYKTQIENLTASIKVEQDNYNSMRERWQSAMQAKNAFEDRVKNVLVEALEDHDEDTVRWIAEQLDIDLKVTKQFEVNVTFTVDVELEAGESFDPEWDLEFSVSHSDLIDYSSDIIYSKEIS